MREHFRPILAERTGVVTTAGRDRERTFRRRVRSTAGQRFSIFRRSSRVGWKPRDS
jgi:hypothetical protein